MGSGAIIDEFHVLTAGHNVYLHDNGGWASSVEVVPGMDGTYKPFGSAMVTDMRSYTGWTQDEMDEHDWAILTLDTKIHETGHCISRSEDITREFELELTRIIGILVSRFLKFK
ncbi:MAG: Extracellular metalloprotease [Candidatus Anoxychlamydiales bacterium]|nr:Extracellular metalloprotease [Candidatus Anoxychlamydiales bacterium]